MSSQRPLKIWITRAEPGAEATAARVRERGHTPLVAPLLAVRMVEDPQIDLILLPTVTALPNLAGEKMRGLAVSSLLRLEAVPALPTFAESLPALRDFDFSIWLGLFAPKGTPVAKTASCMARRPETRRRRLSFSQQPAPFSAQNISSLAGS